MRIAALLVTLVLCSASRLIAGPVVSLEFLNSDFTFGMVNPDQAGFDLSSLAVDGVTPDFFFWPSQYLAQAGPLLQQTVNVSGGEVIGSDYLYGGGTFEIFFDLEKNGSTIQGSFVAPIETLTVSAGEHDGDLATASYVLGEGAFDPAIASALGIGRHTRGGASFSMLLLTDNGNRSGVAGDHDTPERQAWDGANDITLDVPEPAAVALVSMGAGVWIRRRARRPV